MTNGTCQSCDARGETLNGLCCDCHRNQEAKRAAWDTENLGEIPAADNVCWECGRDAIFVTDTLRAKVGDKWFIRRRFVCSACAIRNLSH